MDKNPYLLLASNSPRRRQLLALGGWPFGVDISHVDESLGRDESPAEYVSRLAVEKARAVHARAGEQHIIIGADTSVVIDGEILGKPAGVQEARQMLRRLRGRTHQVYTGIAVLRTSDGMLWSEVVITDVPMRPYDDAEIERYIASGDPMDKAGAYGIQNPDFQPVASMAGCYASVMGLPLCSLGYLLRQAGITASADLPGNCQSTIHYKCPVYQNYLRSEGNS
ncbi:MAG TPA: Maf family protein [Anaerolineales bacterium]|jgi:MAF protein